MLLNSLPLYQVGYQRLYHTKPLTVLALSENNNSVVFYNDYRRKPKSQICQSLKRKNSHIALAYRLYDSNQHVVSDSVITQAFHDQSIKGCFPRNKTNPYLKTDLRLFLIKCEYAMNDGYLYGCNVDYIMNEFNARELYVLSINSISSKWYIQSNLSVLNNDENYANRICGVYYYLPSQHQQYIINFDVVGSTDNQHYWVCGCSITKYFTLMNIDILCGSMRVYPLYQNGIPIYGDTLPYVDRLGCFFKYWGGELEYIDQNIVNYNLRLGGTEWNEYMY